METIRVVWGTATGPTAVGAYDAALAAAGVHEYNLVTVSSVIPADATLDVAETAPDLGATGDRLTVVQGRRTVDPGADEAAAGLAWARSPDGAGVFYEASGRDEAAVRATVEEGVTHGLDLRGRPVDERDAVVRSVDAVEDAYASVVVLAIYGEARPIFERE